ncbi:MAG: M14 family metallopeptidase [Myxococcota bacterium]
MLLSALLIAALPALTTTAEASRYARTGRLEEVVRLCSAFEASYAGRVRCERWGTSPEGRPLLALIASDAGALDPKAAREKSRPVIFIQAGIHAGEIDGKDAGLEILRDLLAGKLLPGVLGKLSLVLVPVFNVDGHERFGKNNRPNQRGPEEMGWRTTAQNFNLNRDYAKADSPEMALMLRYLGAWDPILYADLHVTDGADFQPDIAVLMAPADGGSEPLAGTGRRVRAAIVERLNKGGHLALPFYPDFQVDDDPSSGFAIGTAPPRFQTGYWPERNRLAMLVETHSWKDYPRRVKATKDALTALLAEAEQHAGEWMRAAAETEANNTRLAGTEVTLSWAGEGPGHPIDFPGYAYERRPSAISGAIRVIYDPKRPQIWKVPLRDEVKPKLRVKAPRGGYLVPAAQAGLVREKLMLHGIEYAVIEHPLAAQAVEVFRPEHIELAPASFEGHQTLRLSGAWKAERQSFAAGALWVPIAQKNARLVLQLMEPTAPDSLLAWGFFNAFFEKKEYLEPYVAEEAAEAMLAKDPALREAFVERLKDPKFASSPEERLDFFYARHPARDEALNRYPIVRLDVAP